MMRFELAHDSLAKQIHENVSAELKARQKANLLVQRGLERYQRRKVLLSKEDLEEVKPHLHTISFSEDALDLIQRSRRALVARRNRLIGITAAVMLVLSLLSWWALGERDRANRQKEIAQANALAAEGLLELKSNASANKALALSGRALAIDSTNVNGLKVFYQSLFQDPESVFVPLYFHRSQEGKKINQALFLPDTNLLIAPKDSQLSLINAYGEVIREFNPNLPILAWDLSSDGSYLATATTNQRIIIWDFTSGEQRQTLQYAGDQAVSLVFAPLKNELMVGSSNGVVELIGMSGERLLQLQAGKLPLEDVLFAPDGNHILGIADQRTLYVWNRSGQQTAQLDHFYFPISSISFSNHSGHFITTSKKNTADIWDFSGNEIAKVSNPEHDVIYSAAYASNSDRIITASADGNARVYDPDGTLRQIFDGEGERLVDAAFSPDERYGFSISSEGKIKVWEIASGKLFAELVHPENSTFLYADFSTDGQFLYTLDTDRQLCIWCLDRASFYQILPPNETYTTSVAFQKSGTFFSLVTIDELGTIWSRDGKIVQDLGYGFSTTTWAPGKDQLIFGTLDGQLVLYDLSNQTTKNLSSEHQAAITELIFFNNDKWLLSAAQDGSCVISSFDAQKHETKAIKKIPSLPYAIKHAAVSPDNRWMLLATDQDELYLYALGNDPGLEILDGKLVTTFGSLLNSIAFSPDGTFAAATSEDGNAVLFPVSNAAEQVMLQHQSPVNELIFFPNSKFLVTAADDGALRTWDLAGNLLTTLFSHDLSIIDLELSPDSNSLLSTGDDGQLIFYRIEKGDIQLITTFSHNEIPLSFAKISSSGDYILTGSIEGEQYIFPFSITQLLKLVQPLLNQ